jgi:3-hydroxyacyl-[acyl-carrier-protein] dehydratase
MKLKDDFYRIAKTQRTENGVNFTIQFNADHFIYAAHFPGNPITPGVCITQVVKELTEELVQAPLFLKVVKNIKFTQVINPLQHTEVTFALSTPQSDGIGYKVSASVESSSAVFAKLSLYFAVRSI